MECLVGFWSLAMKKHQAQASFESSSELIKGLVSNGQLRHFPITADEPASFGGEDSAPNPVAWSDAMGEMVTPFFGGEYMGGGLSKIEGGKPQQALGKKTSCVLVHDEI